ncbi:amidohydrolase [Rhizobium sp. P38BS-XIX]|uniref:amidohydrolase family protein n=1 Tax=Rhizobium sp. P38BS-XIX TaxID=2726740 RepID=UPI001456D3EC|nr:amidohydrolase family protein [Rhizobium sp. P38BS-XIX]NLS01273.1 amidohydrolase [Rhizobium sp. P38BS-XIX]
MTRICNCCGIDVHAHIVPAEFPSYLKGALPRGWPSMESADACHKTIVIDGKNYRTLGQACWNGPTRIADMDDMGVRIQALSPMPELFGYWMDLDPAIDLSRYLNDTIAELIAGSDGRFCGLGTVPLQDLNAAIVELHRVVKDLGFAGVEIGSNVNAAAIGDPRFLPFFKEAEALGAAVFVHAVRPAGMDRLFGPGQLQQIIAYPTDVGLAAASVITSNMLQNAPDLRIGFSHGGGTLASLLPRMDEGWRVFPAVKDAIFQQPSLQAKALFYDALVYDPMTLRHITSMFGDTQLFVGTDYPFNFHERSPLSRIEEAFEDAAIQERLAHANAARFLGLSGVRQ